jgi:hypothetical protein
MASSKLISLLLIVIVIIIGVVGFWRLWYFPFFNHELVAFASETVRLRERIHHYRNQTAILSAMPVTRDFAILAAQESGYEKERSGLEQTILEIFFRDPAYYQVRYIDLDGQEIIRINRDQKGIHFTADNQLYNKKDTPFFNEGIRLKNGEVISTDITLTTEGNSLRIPHEATMRFISPVYDQNARSAIGLVVINIRAEELFNPFLSNFGNNLVIFNEEGKYVLHPNKSQLFGEQLGTTHSYFQKFPRTKDKFATRSETPQTHFTLFSYEIWEKVYYNPGDLTKYWIVLTNKRSSF